MIGTTVRSVGAVLAGLVAAAVLVVGVEAFSSVVHPFPPDVDPTDYEVCKAHVSAAISTRASKPWIQVSTPMAS